MDARTGEAYGKRKGNIMTDQMTEKFSLCSITIFGSSASRMQSRQRSELQPCVFGGRQEGGMRYLGLVLERSASPVADQVGGIRTIVGEGLGCRKIMHMLHVQDFWIAAT